jgi:hypothetical protein
LFSKSVKSTRGALSGDMDHWVLFKKIKIEIIQKNKLRKMLSGIPRALVKKPKKVKLF